MASTRYEIHPGGKGLNQSLAAARAGANVLHFGCVGEDGVLLTGVLRDAGVDTQGVRVAEQASGHAVIQVDDEGRNAIVIHGGANRLLTSDDVHAALTACAEGDWLLLQNEINDLEGVLAAASERGVRVAFNVAPVDGREAVYDLSGVSLLIVNEVEAAALSGVAEPRNSAATLLARHPDMQLVLTMGGDGLLYSLDGEIHEMGAFRIEAVDETAAGDAFIGYLMASLLAGEDLAAALQSGSAAGALAATREGAASSIPSPEEVAGLVRES